MNGQVRYNGSVYDILGNIFLGGHQYLIIGDGNENKFIDIAFIEKRIEDGKVRYILPNINYLWDKEKTDCNLVKGQRLMDYVINNIKDKINQGMLITRENTLEYIINALNVLDTNSDIKNSFENFNNYTTEEQFEASIKTLIEYYESGIKLEKDDLVVSESWDAVSQGDVDDAYQDYQDELGKTQNFGVSLFSNINSSVSNTDVKTEDFENSNEEQILPKEENELKEELPAREIPEEPTSLEDIKYLLETRGESMPLQQKLYWESKKNEFSDRIVPNTADLVGANKGRAKTLSNGKSLLSDKAAYISISALLYIIGSFELLMAIILFAKYL